MKISREELQAWQYQEEILWEILNKDKDLEEAIEDIKSFRNTKYYTGNDNKYKIIKE